MLTSMNGMTELTAPQQFELEKVKRSLSNLSREDLERAVIEAWTAALQAQNQSRSILLQTINADSF